MSCLRSSRQHTLCRWPRENAGGPLLLLVAPRPEPWQQLGFSASRGARLVVLLLAQTPRGVPCLGPWDHGVEHPSLQGSLLSLRGGWIPGRQWQMAGLSPRSILTVCCSRRKHNAGLKGKPQEKVELNQIWLDWLPGCDLDTSSGWFWRWMESHVLVLSPVIAAWAERSELEDVCVLGRTDPSLHSASWLQSKACRKEGIEGVRA